MPDLDILQWTAAAVTLLASWLVASRSPRQRLLGFWAFLLSNVLWITWGWHTNAYALIVLQLGLAITNMRGAEKTDATA